MGLGESDDVLLVDDEGAGERKAPAGFGGVVVAEAGVVEGDVDQDGLKVAALLGRDGVGEAEARGDLTAGIGEERKPQAVLVEREDVLAQGLRGDGDEERIATADFGVQVAPGFEFGDAVGVPAAAEEVDDERAEGEEIAGVNGLACACILEGKRRSRGAGLEEAVLDAGSEEFGDGAVGEREALGLDEGADVLSVLVELVLEGGFR